MRSVAAQKVYLNDHGALVGFLWDEQQPAARHGKTRRARRVSSNQALSLAQQADAGDAARLVPRLLSSLAIIERKGSAKWRRRNARNLATVTAADEGLRFPGEGTGVANFSLGLFYWRQNRYAEAEKAGLAAVKIYEGVPGSSRSLLAYSSPCSGGRLHRHG
jgi:hypothetical protein